MTPCGDVVIDVRTVTRAFPTESQPRTLFRVLLDTLSGQQQTLPPRLALQGVSLVVRRGEKVAIVGNNAAGKSTLLKVVAGLLRPTAGTVTVHGDPVLLTSLGVGMIDEVSVADNTLMYGALYGVSPALMRTLLPDVLEWAGMEGHRYAKLKTLSSGTRARLAFSIVRHIAADLFLIDEALSAGDVSFQRKARAFFDEPRHRGRTFLVATHDMAFARSFCTRAVWLHQGRLMAVGDSRAVVGQYLDAQAPPAPERSNVDSPLVAVAG